jgi:hypothetical protein
MISPNNERITLEGDDFTERRVGYVAIESREFYRGPSGDVWLLAREPVTGHLFVRHEAKRISHIEVGAFLMPANREPEHLALRSLIGTLIVEISGRPA